MSKSIVVFCCAVILVSLLAAPPATAVASTGISRMNSFIRGLSPVSYYSFDDYARFDSSTLDRTGRGYPATFTGIATSAVVIATTGAGAVEDRAFSIQNAGGRLRVPFGSAVLSGISGGASWGVSLFVRPASLPGSGSTEVVVLQTAGSGCGTGWTLFYRGDGSVGVRLASTLISSTSSGAVVANKWNLIRLGVTNISPYASTLVISAETSVSTFVFVTRSDWVISSTSCMLDVVNTAVVMGVDEMAIFDRDLTVNEYDTMQYLGSRGACRVNPCFTGVTCTPTDSVTYSCGSCPSGYFGDGMFCDSTIPKQQFVACYPSGANATNTSYCAGACKTRTKCFECALHYTGLAMIDARAACRQAEIRGDVLILVALGVQYPWTSSTPSYTVTPSRSPTGSPTQTPTFTPTPSRSPSLTPSKSSLLVPTAISISWTGGSNFDTSDTSFANIPLAKTLYFTSTGNYGHAHSGTVNFQILLLSNGGWVQVGAYSTSGQMYFNSGVVMTFNLTNVSALRVASSPAQNQSYHGWGGATFVIRNY